MPAFHIFNPGHETAVLLGTPNYTPPANVGIMAKDLAYLPLWYAQADDLIYVGKEENDFPKTLPQELGSFASSFQYAKRYTKEYIFRPWGISPHILHYITTATRESNIKLIIPEWKQEYSSLTGRQSTIRCHRLLCKQLSELALPSPPEIMESVEAIEAVITQNELPIVLKTPYSSSGRGVLWIRNPILTNAERNWIKGAIQKQNFVSLEKGLNKTMDFAMEFYADGEGNIHYEGLSLFETEQKGAYTGNRLMPQTALQNKIESSMNKESLLKIRQAVTETLKTVYGDTYKGYLGVDMLLYEQNNQMFIHPCIEVNLRFTMGLVALRLFERYIHPEAYGSFYVTFDKEAGKALTEHNNLKKNYPLQISTGRIKKGYLSLCPVTEKTHYRAYIIV